MKQVFHRISILKTADACIQVVAFIVMLLLLDSTGPGAFFIEAQVQVLSCCIWGLYFRANAPAFRPAMQIREIFFITLAVWISGSLIPPVGFALLYMMLLVGPVLGLWYFIATVREVAFYRDARKPYYLL